MQSLTADAELARDVGEACAPVFDQLGLTIKDCLACGFEGCVFAVSGGKVAKITARLNEPKFAAYLAKHPNMHAALPRVEGVWQLPPFCVADADLIALTPDKLDKLGNWIGFQPAFRPYMFDDKGIPSVYLVIREDLKDLEGLSDVYDYPVYEFFNDCLGVLNGRVADVAKGRAEIRDLEDAIFEQHDLLTGDEGEYYTSENSMLLTYFNQVADLMLWSVQEDLPIYDLHVDNLGLRRGKKTQVVARDLGFATVKDRQGREQPVLVPIVEES